MLVLSLADSLIRDVLVPTRHSDVDFLDSSEKYEEIGVKVQKLFNEGLFVIGPRQLEVDGGVVRSLGLWKTLPDRRYYTQRFGTVKFERKLIRCYPYYISSFENRLEANSFLADKFAIASLAALGALADSTNGCHITGVETYLIAVDSETPRFVREAQSRSGAAIDIVVSILDEF